MKRAREPASSRPKPYTSLKNAPGILPVGRSLLALVGRKQTVIRSQLFRQKPPCSRLLFSRMRVQHSPGSFTTELPSAFAESGAYSPDRACHGTLLRAAAPYHAFRDSVPCLSRATTSRRAPSWSSEKAHLVLNQPNHRRVSTDRLNREDKPVGCIS